MRVVYEAEHLFDAQWVKDAIEAAGYPAFVLGGNLQGGIGELPVLGLIRVAVPDGAYPAVSALLIEWQSREQPAARDNEPELPWDGVADPI